MGKYSFDTSAFVNTRRRYYPPDLFPTLWEKIDEFIDNRIIVASSVVKDELSVKDDQIYKYVSAKAVLFEPLDSGQQTHVSSIVNRFPQWIPPKFDKESCGPICCCIGNGTGVDCSNL
jgi:hypothetical protein